MVQTKRILFSVGLGVITLIILMVIINPLNLDLKLTNHFKFNFTFTGFFAGNRTLNETEPLLESLEETTTTSVETTSTSTTTVLTTTSPGTTTTATTTSTSTTTVPSANHVVFSEVFYDTPGKETDEEWIELYNPISNSIDLSGLKIENKNGYYTIPNGISIDRREFLVIARNETGFKNLYGFLPDISGLTFDLVNTGDVLRLKNGSDEIDMVAWENFVSEWDLEANEGESIQRTLPNKDTDTASDWISHAYPGPDIGGLINSTTTTSTTTTSSTTTTTTTTSTTPSSTTIPHIITNHIVISEIQIGDNEFVELYNPTNEDVNMTGWYFSYFSSNNDWNSTSRNKQFPDGSITKAYSFYLIGLNGYPTPIADWQPYSASQLSNTNGSVAIFPFDPTTKTSDEAKSSRIDVVGWGSPSYVFEGQPFPAPAEGKSMERKLGYLNSTAGNAWDTNNNIEDFILRELPEPQNSTSTIEVPS